MELVRRLVSPRALLWIGAALATTTTVVLLRLFGLSLLLSILILLTIGLIVIILLLLRQLKQVQAAKEIERTISRQADVAIERSVPGKVQEMQDLKTELLAALDSLKSSKVTGRRGESALSTLPWYMVIGPAGAGKSTLIRSSGLHFPLRDAEEHPRSVRGVGGTRSFEWWLSQEAVLLDMGGRTLSTAQFEDTDDWIAFLEVLRKQRKAKPLNGVMVAVPLEQIAEQTEAQVTTLARSLRERVQELVHHLRTIYPVYVVFTKCDRVAGFSEFFADLEPAERAQPWGATLSLERSRSDPAEVVFDEEFGILTAALSDRRMLRLPEVTDQAQRARVFTFPLELEAVRSKARRFLRVLFEEDPAGEIPLFRGFYFTSSLAEGARDGAYFVKDLLGRVIFPDAGLATPSVRAEVVRRRNRVLLFGGLGVLLLATVILLSVLSAVNGRLVGRTRKAAEEVATRVQDQAPILENLSALERLRSQVAVVDSLTRRKPFWRRLGGYSGDLVRDPALKLYVEKAVDVLIAPSVRIMEQRLADYHAGGGGTFLEHYSLFSAWRLLTSPQHIKPEDAPLLSRVLADVLGSRVMTPSPEERERFPRLLSAQVWFLTAHPDWLTKYAVGQYSMANDELVARGAERVVRTWDSSQFYRRMIRDALPFTSPVGLPKLVSSPGYLTASRAVAGPFTKEGWEREVKPRIEAHRRRMEADWVLAEAFHGRQPDLAHDLLRLYARDYSAHWVQFLNSVGVRPVNSMGQSAELLKWAGAGNSPVIRLVRAVGQETDLGADPQSELGRMQQDFAIAREFFESPQEAGPTRKITGFFMRVIQRGGNTLDRTQPASSHYGSVLGEAAEQIEKAGQPDAPASEVARVASSASDASSPIKGALLWTRQLQASYEGDAGSAAVARVLRLPIDAAMGPPCEVIKNDLSSKWNLLVVQPFQNTLGGKYPFAEGGPDASLEDFTEFFKPGGTLWKFYDDYLSAHLAEDGSAKNEQGTRCFSPEFTAFLKQAFEVREAFFSADPKAASLRFNVRTSTPHQEGPPVNVRGISFDVGGQATPYSMGAPLYREVVWPGADPGFGAALRIQTAPGAPAAEARGGAGPWGLFRLLDQGQFTGADESATQILWRIRAGSTLLAVAYDIQPSSAHHPFRAGSLRIRMPSGP